MTYDEGHIGTMEGVLLLYATLTTKLFLQYPAFLVDAGGPAGWQVALVMTAVALVLYLPTVALARRFPGQALCEIGEQVAGSFLGTILSLTISIWLLAEVTLTLRNVTENFIISILPQTPPSVLAGVLVLCMVYAAYCGIESVARTTRILFPVMITGLLVLMLFNLPRWVSGRLFPFWGHGLYATTSSGLLYAGMGADALALLVMGSVFRKPGHLRTSGLMGILLFGLTATATVALLVGVFGASDASQQPFPMFTLSRLVYLGRFFQRTESILVMFWFFAAAVRLGTLFHAAAIGITGCLHLPFYRPLLFPLAVLAGSLSLLPDDFMVVLRTDRDIMRPLGTAMFFIPLLLLVIAAIRRKGGTADAS